MKTEKAIQKAGSINKLATIFDCSRQVIQHWKRSGVLPAVRIIELRTLRPEWFKR